MKKLTQTELKILTSDKNLIILKKEYGENKVWRLETAQTAFADILESTRWGNDCYIEELEVLTDFIVICNEGFKTRKTERFSYIFLNLAFLQKSIAE